MKTFHAALGVLSVKISPPSVMCMGSSGGGYVQSAGGRDSTRLILDERSIKVIHADLSAPRRRAIRGSPRPPLLDQIRFRLWDGKASKLRKNDSAASLLLLGQ